MCVDAVLAQHNTIQRKKRNVLSVLSDDTNRTALKNQVRGLYSLAVLCIITSNSLSSHIDSNAMDYLGAHGQAAQVRARVRRCVRVDA